MTSPEGLNGGRFLLFRRVTCGLSNCPVLYSPREEENRRESSWLILSLTLALNVVRCSIVANVNQVYVVESQHLSSSLSS